MCRNWVREGKCPYSEKCQFAHGVGELEKWNDIRRRQLEGRLKGKPVAAPINPASSSSSSNSETRRRKDSTSSNTSSVHVGPEAECPPEFTLEHEDTTTSSSKDVHYQNSRQQQKPQQQPQRALPEGVCWADRESRTTIAAPIPMKSHMVTHVGEPLSLEIDDVTSHSLHNRGFGDENCFGSFAHSLSSACSVASSSSMPSYGSFASSVSSSSMSASAYPPTMIRQQQYHQQQQQHQHQLQRQGGEGGMFMRSGSIDSQYYTNGPYMEYHSRRHSSLSSLSQSSLEFMNCTCSSNPLMQNATPCGFCIDFADDSLKLPSDFLDVSGQPLQEQQGTFFQPRAPGFGRMHSNSSDFIWPHEEGDEDAFSRNDEEELAYRFRESIDFEKGSIPSSASFDNFEPSNITSSSPHILSFLQQKEQQHQPNVCSTQVPIKHQKQSHESAPYLPPVLNGPTLESFGHNQFGPSSPWSASPESMDRTFESSPISFMEQAAPQNVYL